MIFIEWNLYVLDNLNDEYEKPATSISPQFGSSYFNKNLTVF